MSLGIWQLVLILLVVLILFGAGRLPRVMGDIGKGVRSLKKGLHEDEDESNKQIDDNGQSSGHQRDKH
jgi:sec-independent protein translocase protein TatA